MLRKNLFIKLRANGLFQFTILNFLDKGLNFLVPLLILKLNDQNIYGDIEYIISCSLLGASFLDFGIRTYSFFDYKNNAGEAIRNLGNSLNLLQIVQCLFFVIFVAIRPSSLSLAICFRTTFYTYQYCFCSYARLIDKPMLSFKFSLPVNILLITVLVLCYVFNIKFHIGQYTFLYGCFNFYTIVEALKYPGFIGRLKACFNYVLQSLKFAWPLLVCLVISSFQQNMLKVFGYGLLDTEQYSKLSLTLRLFMVLVLLHSSISAYYCKAIYTGKEQPFALILKFLAALSAGMLLVWSVWLILPHVSTYNLLSVTPMTLLSLYYLFFCMRAFLESYVAKFNKVKSIAIYTSISFVVFIILLWTIGAFSLSSIIASQLIAEIINIIMVSLKIRILINEEKNNNN